MPICDDLSVGMPLALPVAIMQTHTQLKQKSKQTSQQHTEFFESPNADFAATFPCIEPPLAFRRPQATHSTPAWVSDAVFFIIELA